MFRTLRQLAESYFDPFIDKTGLLKAFGVVDLRVLGDYDWRLSSKNVWKVERLLFEIRTPRFDRGATRAHGARATRHFSARIRVAADVYDQRRGQRCRKIEIHDRDRAQKL